MARKTRASTLAAGDHDGSHSAFGWRIRRDLAAPIAGRVGKTEHSGTWISYGGRSRTGRFDHAPGATHSCIPRPQDVEALMAEPRGADVRRVLKYGRRLCGIVAVAPSVEFRARRIDGAAGRRWDHRECMHLPGARSPRMEQQAYDCRLLPDRRHSRAFVRCKYRRGIGKAPATAFRWGGVRSTVEQCSALSQT